MIEVRPLNSHDRPWADEVEAESWGGGGAARMGELVDPGQLPGFVAFLDGDRAGPLRLERS